jgi:signal transduction histidine kinase/HPt (histidine-containing phosphotransfer) domain-containing protein
MNFRATRNERRAAGVLVAVSTLAFLAMVPFANVQLAHLWAFIPTYESALVVNDLTTAALLIGQLRFFRSRRLLALASGYLFTAFLCAAHALSFPGLFSATGLLAAGPQTTAWLYMFWHGGFPLFVIGYALLDGEFASDYALAAWLAATGAVAAVLTAVATSGHDLLPAIMSGNQYTAAMIMVVGSVWLTCVVALVALAKRRERTSLDVWLMVVMFAWIFDIGLSAVFNAGRFDLGFYAGRAYGLLAASLVLAVLLVQDGALYRQLRHANRELRQAKEAALAAERAEAAFLATMSHEIRTPMSGVIGMLELIELTRLEGEQRTMFAVVNESARALMRIVDDILDHSKIAAGKLDLRPQPTSLAAAVQRVFEIYNGNASSKGLQLTRSFDERISPSVMVDEFRVRQILNNLVSNAIKFTVAGSVEIRAELQERRQGVDVVRFTVADTGPGISPEDRARLFKPFSQASRTTAGGTGLGLSICCRLAGLMGGLLEMQSTPGVGTKVHLTLPLPVADSPALPRDDAAALAAPLAGPDLAPTIEEAKRAGALVLVVDDSPINRLLLVKQLGSLGYAAQTAENGLEAVARWSEGNIALVITDCHMPEMNGYELARHIRDCESRNGLRRTPIIACTASALSGESAECFVSGMDDRLVKPVQRDVVRRALQRWLPTASPIDPAAIAELCIGDTRDERRLLERFWSFNGDDAAALRACVAADDLDGVIQAAHRITGASRTVGAVGLADICESIERDARCGNWTAVRSTMPRLERELARIQAHIASMRSAA